MEMNSFSEQIGQLTAKIRVVVGSLAIAGMLSGCNVQLGDHKDDFKTDSDARLNGGEYDQESLVDTPVPTVVI